MSTLLAPGELVNSFIALPQSSHSAQSLLRQSHLWNFKLQLEELVYLRDTHHLELTLTQLARETPTTIGLSSPLYSFKPCGVA